MGGYTISFICGALLTLIIVHSCVIREKDRVIDHLTNIIIERQNQLYRDDRILNMFMDGNWDRSCDYYREPDEVWDDGTVIWSVEKVGCNE
jgi:hypothetical protein